MSWQAKSASPPPGYVYGARYRPTVMNFLVAGAHILRAKPRSFAADVLLALRHAPAPPLVRGADRIPESGPFVLAANHYERPGLWMAWPAALLAHLVWERRAGDLHWIAIQEWESLSLWGVPVPPALTRLVFERAFAVYGILAMAPPNASAGNRAASMRQAVQIIKSGGVIGLMPEGDVGATPALLPAREGVGAFLLLLAGAGAPVLPAGVYEEGGRLVAHVGDPFALTVPPSLARADRDRWARHRVMLAIRDLLPEPLHGDYRDVMLDPPDVPEARSPA